MTQSEGSFLCFQYSSITLEHFSGLELGGGGGAEGPCNAHCVGGWVGRVEAFDFQGYPVADSYSFLNLVLFVLAPFYFLFLNAFFKAALVLS